MTTTILERALTHIDQQHEDLKAAKLRIDEAVAELATGWCRENYPDAAVAVFKRDFEGHAVVTRLENVNGGVVADSMNGTWPLRELSGITCRFTEDVTETLMEHRPAFARFALNLVPHTD